MKSKKNNIYKFIFKVIKILAVFLVIFIFAIIGIIGGTVLAYIRSTEALTPKDLALKGFTSVIYDSNGNKIMQLYAEKNREMVDSKDIPKNLKRAFVAIEDKRFYEHSGIDFIRIGSAAISFFKEGKGTHGASTITQQVIKNVTGQDQRSLKRKVQEQWRAIELEKKLSKDQILELYLNIVPMGRNCCGVQSASKMYFNKDVKNLTLAECASLAGITNLPSVYDPLTTKGKEKNIIRQKIILKEMLNSNFITQEEYDNAIKESLQFGDPSKDVFKATHSQPYFVDQVVLDVKKDLMAKGYSEDIAIKTIYNNGLKIYTTMDTDVQNCMNEVFTDTKRYFPIINTILGQPQGAMVIIDPKNGQIKALYGGSGAKIGNTLNRASSSLMQRQPGSTFKPIAVYGPAIDKKKITAATVVDDVPVYFNGDTKRYPENYDHTYSGITNIHNAIRDSINVVAAKTWNNILGPDLSLQFLKDINIERPNERYVSLSLGGLTKGVNPMQMAAAYVPFANKGIYYEPSTYTRVEDSQGNIILNKVSRNKIVFDNEATPFIMTSMMKSVVTLGTAYPYGLIQNGQMPTAGKTGTTSDNKDKWFAGYSPYYVAVSWYGYDKPSTLSSAEYNRALIIWHDVMEKVHKNLKPTDFSKPSNLVKKTICIYSGKVPSSLCYKDPRNNSIREEYFIKGTEPDDDEECDVHVLVNVCSESHDGFGRNLLASSDCPDDAVSSKIFIERKDPYIPIKSGEPYPLDMKYTLPTEHCTCHNQILETPKPTSEPEEKGEPVDKKNPKNESTPENDTIKKPKEPNQPVTEKPKVQNSKQRI